MSSLSATQSDGYYIPPEYLESGAFKKKSLNQFNKNIGHNQYLRNSVVRFELPYDGFCTDEKCGAHVGKGTRFNAHKAHSGFYHSTKIWEFSMKCRACASSKFIIRTNPQGRCFDYCSGIKKKVEEFNTDEAGTLGVIDTDIGNKIIKSDSIESSRNQGHGSTSKIDKLQQEKLGERKAIAEREAIEFLMEQNRKIMSDDASSNSKLRSDYRQIRKAKKRRLIAANVKGLGKGIELPDATETDANAARLAFGGDVKKMKSRKIEKQKFAAIRSRSIFSNRRSAYLLKDSKVSASRKKDASR